MTIRAAVKRAWQTYTRRLPDMLQYTLLTLVVHAMPIVPLLSLLDLSLWPMLLLTPVLFILLVLPMRLNAAEMMQQALHGGRLFGTGLVSFEHYGQKVMRGVRQMLLLLAWALPVLAVSGGALWLYKQQGVAGFNDAFTLFRYIRDLGGGDLPTGMIDLLLIFLSLWVPLIVGCAFHSGARHAHALGDRRLMKGSRGKQMLTWLTAQCVLLPWLTAIAIPVAQYVPKAFDAVQRYEFSSAVPGKGMLIGMAVSTLVLLLPALPLRDLIIAAYPACKHDETRADA